MFENSELIINVLSTMVIPANLSSCLVRVTIFPCWTFTLPKQQEFSPFFIIKGVLIVISLPINWSIE